MKKTVMVAGGLLLPTIIVASYYGLRHAMLPYTENRKIIAKVAKLEKTIEDAEELFAIYERLMMEDLGALGVSLQILQKNWSDEEAEEFKSIQGLQEHHAKLANQLRRIATGE